MPDDCQPPDAELLRRCGGDPELFAVFYRRHLPTVLGFVLRRLGDRELAADLTAEVFAAALVARASFDPERGAARAWLCTIAANKIVDSLRRGRVEDACRRRLAFEPVALHDADLERVDQIVSADAEGVELGALLAALEPGTREAVELRVLQDMDYAEIAARLQCSESVVRKRVSRGLARLRTQFQETR